MWAGFDLEFPSRKEFFDSIDKIGYAVPLTKDGYMLTAAHVISDEVCGIPFDRTNSAQLLNSPCITSNAMLALVDGTVARRPSENLGFRRIRLVKSYPELDVAIVHVKGEWVEISSPRG